MTVPTSQTAKRSSTAGVRAFRERRRPGVRLVQIRITVAEIEALEGLGYLGPDLRENAGSIQKAVQALVSDTPWM
ncbi:MAG: hypothetical protein ACLQNV_14475 [Steroidobacteraceae bacterium]